MGKIGPKFSHMLTVRAEGAEGAEGWGSKKRKGKPIFWKSIFRCSLPTAMSISRIEILRRKKKKRKQKF